MNLSRLIYYSERNPSAPMDLPSLLRVCHRNNAAANLTGILFYNGRSFLQVLEGGRAEVSAIYHRIATDRRHFNIILISCYDARERLFPAWSMGLYEGETGEAREVFLRYFATDAIDPESVSADSLLDVLLDFSDELE